MPLTKRGRSTIDGTCARVLAAVLSLLLPGADARATSAQSAPTATPQGTRDFSSSSGTMPLSASVMGTYLIRNIGAGDVMELLVLWRGAPGWIAKGDQSGSGGGTSRDTWRHRFSQGGLEFEITADLAKRTLQLLGQTVDVKSGNAILVEDVDGPRGGRIVRTLTVDARLGEERTPARILPVLGRSRELRDYLRCEAGRRRHRSPVRPS